MDLTFLYGNPFYIAISFVTFHALIGQPFFDFDFVKSALLFAVLYILYKKYGKTVTGDIKQTVSAFGSNKSLFRHHHRHY
jgi:hypothetical protein